MGPGILDQVRRRGLSFVRGRSRSSKSKSPVTVWCLEVQVGSMRLLGPSVSFGDSGGCWPGSLPRVISLLERHFSASLDCCSREWGLGCGVCDLPLLTLHLVQIRLSWGICYRRAIA